MARDAVTVGDDEGVTGSGDGGAARVVGDEVEVVIHGISSEGAGVGTLPDGRVVFVHRTAPGDRARVELTRLRKSWARARLREVVEPGGGRRAAPCPHYERCGGCTLEHLVYREQLRWKGVIVADALERIGGVTDAEVPHVTPSMHEFRYRNRVSFHLRRLDDDRVVAGFHALEEPGRIVDVGAECLLPEEPVARVWGGLRDAWGEGAVHLPPGPALRLTLRRVVDGVALLVEPDGDGGGTTPERVASAGAEALVEEVPGLRSVWWRGEARGASLLLAGEGETTQRWWGRDVRVDPSTFLQVNREVGEALHDAVLAELTEGGVAGLAFLDAYCGIAGYAREVARRGGRATGIELDAEAVRTGLEDAPPGLTILEGRVEDRLPEALPVDRAVLNPPRAGLAAEIPPILRERGPERVVYVSCDPATLARDVSRLQEAYELERLRAFDLFPQTAHVETVAVLSRAR